MPEMDGYELARKIRATEARDRSRPIPIIACTANAMGGEAEKCFAAGMNDYLSKPVELRRLAEKMDQWLPLPGAATAPSHGDAESAIAFDRSILDDACGGDGSMALEMLDAFARHHATDLARLTDAIHSGDYAAARKLAHRIKGSAATVGAPALARAAAALEHMQEGDGAGWKQGVARIVSERERFDRIARDALAGVAPGASV
jgi:CheY-like chemotaxis protein